MSVDDSFAVLMLRVRAGDAEAASELVRLYEPEIRRLIRVRLTDPRLRRVMDSTHICQSVLGNFFVRVAAGQFELDRPQQLVRLLVTMAQNRIRDHARRQHAGRRDQRRLEAAGRELLDAMCRRLSDEERFLADQRTAGREWDDIAAELSRSPEARILSGRTSLTGGRRGPAARLLI